MSELTQTQQNQILSNIRSIVPDGVRGVNDRRHTYLVGALVAMNAVDPNLVPVHWTALVLAHRVQELFHAQERTNRGEAVAGMHDINVRTSNLETI